MPKVQSVIRLAAFSLIEVLLSISLFSIFVMMLVAALLQSQENADLTSNRLRAAQFAEEGLEAMRSIKNENYEGLSDGDYGLSWTGGKWILSGTQDTQDRFIRQVNISTISDSLKLVRLTVTWPQTAARTATLSFESYLSNWSLPRQGDWTEPTPDPEPLPDNVAGIKIQTQGNYAYVVRGNQTANFIILDVTNPSSPQILATLDLPGTPTNIALSGNYAFVSNMDNQQNIQAIDISNPNSPIFNPAWTFKGIGNEPATSISIVGNRAYMTREYKNISNSPTFYIVDISNPADMKALGYLRLREPLFGLPVSAFDVYASGNYAYVASGFFRTGIGIIPYIQTVDVSTSNPVLVNTQTPFSLSLLNFGNATSISGYGNTITLGQDQPGNRIYTYTISNPTTPSLAANFATEGKINDVCFGPNSNYAYLATEASTKEFQLIDVSNPSSPTLVGSSDLDGILNGISYSPSKDRVFAVGNQDQGQFIVISPK